VENFSRVEAFEGRIKFAVFAAGSSHLKPYASDGREEAVRKRKREKMSEGNKLLDWNPTSSDYAKYRPGYPENFFGLLKQFGVGTAGQDILDLGSGTGALAIPFALSGARVTAVDLSENQIAEAKKIAAEKNLDMKFAVCPAENTDFADGSFDAITASMCFGYFDSARAAAEISRLLRKEGLLMISSIIWERPENALASGGIRRPGEPRSSAANIPAEDLALKITEKTERLILKYNGNVARTGSLDATEICPGWSAEKFRLKTFHRYKVGVPFTRESWRGRIRASKWIGAALGGEEVRRFDAEHEKLLEEIAPEKFEIKHTVKIQIFELK